MQQHDTTYVNRGHKSLQCWYSLKQSFSIRRSSSIACTEPEIYDFGKVSIYSSINEPTIQILVRLPKNVFRPNKDGLFEVKINHRKNPLI
jgi:hypothetical protein